MTIAVETYLVVALAFAVFSAVVALGSSLVLGIGFERLRAGFEVVKKQTGFFSESIRTLDKRVDGVEKQGQYFFETLHNLEEQMKDPGKGEDKAAETVAVKDMAIRTQKPAADPSNRKMMALWDKEPEDLRFH